MTRVASACSGRVSRPTPWARRLASPVAGCIRPGGRPARGTPTTDDLAPRVIPLGERARCDDLAAAEIPSRNTPTDRGDDLVADRAAGFGEILGRLPGAGLRTDEHDLVALARVRDVGHVEHHEVHADAPRES